MFRLALYNLFFILLLFVVSINVSAQQKNSSVKLFVKNEKNMGVAFATVSIVRASDSVVIFSKSSDSTGFISHLEIPAFPVYLELSSTGYLSNRTPALDISHTSSDTLFYKMQSNGKSLAGISITFKKPLIENRMDKTVVNVDAYISNAGSTVLDALSNAPNVDIDNNGNISLKGKSQVVVYIDGKQNYLSGSDLSNYLKTIPSSLADQIEIMTQPSAKYDAAGNAGVINIKLKKNTAKGMNLALSANYAQGKYSRSANSLLINYKSGKWNLFGNLSDIYSHPYTNRTIGRILNSQINHTSISSSQIQDQLRIANVLSIMGGVSYLINNKSDIGFLLSSKLNNRTDDIEQNTHFFDLNSQVELKKYTLGKNTIINNWNNTSAAVNLHHKMNGSGDISVDLNYENYKFRPYQNFQNAGYDENGLMVGGSTPNPFFQKTDHPSDIDLLSLKTDYSFIVRKIKIETGIKSCFIRSRNVSNYYELMQGVFTHNNNLSSIYNYNENINSVYFKGQRSFSKIDAQAGFRVEQTISLGTLVNTLEHFSKNYFKVFPTLYFGYKFSENSSLSLSYAKRIDRPAYLDLNPFSFIVDPYTINKGNPLLRPYLTNNFEAGYNFKQKLNISANYSVTSRLIDDNIYQDDQTGILIQNKDNLFHLENVGLTFNYTANFSSWGTLLISNYLYRNHFSGIVNAIKVDRFQTTNMISATQQFLLGQHWSAELFATYNSSTLIRPWFFRGPKYRSSITIGKGVLNNKGSLKFKISDPFNIEKGFGSNDFNNIHTSIKFKEDSRIVSVTFSYRFQKGHKTIFKNLYAPDEKNRLQ